MDNYILPADPADPRPDFALWSGWPTRQSHLTTNPDRQPAPYPVDFKECFCGAHVWQAADGRWWSYGDDPELHHCPTPETPLEAAETAFRGAWQGDGLDDAATAINDLLVEARRRYAPTQETLAETPELPDLVIE